MLARSLLPQTCVLCGAGVGGYHLCRDCKGDLPWITVACERCGLPLAEALPAGTYCARCQKQPAPVEKAFAPLLYTFPVDNALKALKFRRQLFHAPVFGALLVQAVIDSFADVDALLPVPLHWRRHASRGFNQAAELCRPLRRECGLPVIGNARRVKFTKPQTGLNATERRRNMKAAFEIRGVLGYRHPLVVDDVITTGETCRQLAITLLRSGAEKVSVLAVARAVSP